MAKGIEGIAVRPLLEASANFKKMKGEFPKTKMVWKTRAADIQKGDGFIAYPGVTFDGHQAIAEAVDRGAAGIILSNPKAETSCGQVPYAVVKNSRKAWSWIAAAAYSRPEQKLKLVGVTGTNGKTSTTWMVKELLRALGKPSLLIGTMGAWLGDEFRPSQHTTPDPDVLFGLLDEAARRGIDYVVMEVSSHAIAQEKLGPIQYDAAAFTSFSRDHLDFHRDMTDYFDAKGRLFSEFLQPDGFGLVCRDVNFPHEISAPTAMRFYGEKNQTQEGDIVATPLASDFMGTRLLVNGVGKEAEGTIPFFGAYAVKNFLAALALTHRVTGITPAPSLWQSIKAVPGRLEPVHKSNRGPFVFVDYAHTPDALEKTLAVLRPLCKGRLWVVFGCGGDRDQGKRPQMATIAEKLADEIVVTSDNPRTENPEQIIKDILAGFCREQPNVFVGREEAIAYAVTTAAADDSILIAGKGHEDYQIIGKDKRPFDDRKVAAKALGERT